MKDPIRIFVGCDPNDCDLEQMMVLDYSLRKNASQPVEIVWMQLSGNPASFWYSDPAKDEGWHTAQWHTPFSGLRWGIPAYCGFEGRAIYMDTDMIVLSDIAELWNTELAAETVIVAKRLRFGDKRWRRFCVSLWDCAKAKPHLPPVEALRASPTVHEENPCYFADHGELVQPLPWAFNNVDGNGEPIERIKILHYSDIGTQFSNPYALPRLAAEGREHWFDGEVLPHPRADLQGLFDQTYREALAAGYSVENYRNPHKPTGFVKKSLKNYQGFRLTRRNGWMDRLCARLQVA